MIQTGELFPKAKRTVILASAGAGKTTWLMERISNEMLTVDPSRIAFVTFTRKGVEEGISRMMEQHPSLDASDLVYFRTFHSLCFHELNIDYKKLWGVQHEHIINKAIGSSVHRRYSSEHATYDNRCLDQYDLLRNGGKTDSTIICTPAYKRLIAAYELVKRRTGAVDFTDCLTQFVSRNKSIPVDVAFIDEAQDMTDLQWDVANVALQGCKRVYIAGDDFQAIFTYAGANPEVLINLAKTSECVKLEVSHRIPMKVYRLAKSITEMIEVKEDKDYAPETSRQGTVEFLSDLMSLYPYLKADLKRSWYILTRNTSFQDGVCTMLQTMCIPYTANGSFVIPRRDMALIHKFYQFRKEGFAGTDAARAFKIEHGIQSLSESFVDASLFPPEKSALYQSYIDRYGEDAMYIMSRGKCRIVVSNIHRVKGGEADNVAVLLDCGRKVEQGIQENPDVELHTLYVAVTRAKDRLFLIHAERNGALDELLERCLETARIRST